MLFLDDTVGWIDVIKPSKQFALLWHAEKDGMSPRDRSRKEIEETLAGLVQVFYEQGGEYVSRENISVEATFDINPTIDVHTFSAYAAYVDRPRGDSNSRPNA